MAGANLEGIKKVYGTSALERVKTCEFHFKECRNRQARKLDEDVRSQFKRLCDALLKAESPVGYEAAKEDIMNFMSGDGKLSFLMTWFDWWDKRRGLIFPAFLPTMQGASKMNQAETIHASWVKRDRINLSLFDTAQADIRDNIQLEVEYKAFENGLGKGGKGPSIHSQTKKNRANQLNRAHTLGRELTREDITDTDRVQFFDIANQASGTNAHDRHNATVGRGPRRMDGERNGRFRSTRSRHFLDRLEKAKLEQNRFKIKHLREISNLERSYVLVSGSSAIYKTTIAKKHSCQCLDYVKSEGKELCKHVIWVLLNICEIPEESELLQQVFLTEMELSEIFSNTQPIPNHLKYIPGSSQQSRHEMVKKLLANDTRNGKPKVWLLKRKEKRKGTVPRCRGCRKEQFDGDLTISVVGLYVPYEQNFVVETTFYFCPDADCVKRIPLWINLDPPTAITVHGSITSAELEHLQSQSELPLANFLM
jgi:hypothetical protein